MLFGSSQPGVLPRGRNILVVPAKLDVAAVAVAEFQRLVAGDGNRDGASDTGVKLAGERIFYAVDTCDPAEPEIAIERRPEPPRKIVAQMRFKGADWILRLRPCARIIHIA